MISAILRIGSSVGEIKTTEQLVCSTLKTRSVKLSMLKFNESFSKIDIIAIVTWRVWISCVCMRRKHERSQCSSHFPLTKQKQNATLWNVRLIIWNWVFDNKILTEPFSHSWYIHGELHLEPTLSTFSFDRLYSWCKSSNTVHKNGCP